MLITSPLDPKIRLTGRIDTADDRATFCWCGNQLALRFKGTYIAISAENECFGPDTLIGAVIDGEEREYYIGRDVSLDLVIAENLPDDVHDVVIYKREEGHYFTVKSITVDGELLELPPKPEKRIEVYGDSVSAGSVVDAHEYVGKSDPEHHGQWDNAWHAYPQIVARMLPAEVYDTSQGGIAIFDRTGYFEMPDTRGVESCYDLVRYSAYKPKRAWDWSFVPHVVIMAVGQNDAHPDPDCLKNKEYYEKWVGKYIEIINGIRSHAPKATVILALTVLMHDSAWDDALRDIANRLGGKEGRAYHFMYTRTGKATPGHPRYEEQVEMAEEMTAFLKSLPADTWDD